jgi:light-regulated signal transduction histidine kinase (bacteriophytochrome)
MGGVPSWGFYVTILLAATFLSATLLAIRLHTLSRLILLQESERRQREEVQRSNRDLEAFAHTVSHDLRAPLRSIQGFLEVLETDYAGHLGDDEKELLHRAGQGAERLELMIRDVLTYSRVGGAAAEVHPIAVREAVDAALEQLRAAIRDSGAEITVADDLPTVRADATDLVRLFQNLLGNAIKYRAPERRAGIRVGVDRRDDAWRFAVADNGVGIARDDVERIFGLFQRSGDPNDEGGFGVGLAVCRKIVARYGGRIWVDSEVGVGSTFFFTLPA